MAFTQKQIDKFNRQKYIIELEKISKNIFRMLRDDNIDASQFSSKLEALKIKFDKRLSIHLDSEYHQQLKAYIIRLHKETVLDEVFDTKILNDMREPEMSNLNRLQKLKNSSSYKKDKHKSKEKNQDWG